jgi:hypothetical protein
MVPMISLDCPATMSSKHPLSPDWTTSEQREKRNYRQLARRSRGIHSRSLEASGVLNLDRKGNLGPPWCVNRQGLASTRTGEDEHQGISGAGPYIPLGHGFSIADVRSRSPYRVRSFCPKQKKIANGTEHKNQNAIRLLPRLCNHHLSIAQSSDRTNAYGSGA